MDSGQGRIPVLSVRASSFHVLVYPLTLFDFLFSYWVLAVGCFLLYCFVNDHSLELCLKIYKVGVRHHPRREYPREFTCYTTQIPVALAMWNQLGSEGIDRHSRLRNLTLSPQSCSRLTYSHIRLFQSECIPPEFPDRLPVWTYRVPTVRRDQSDGM